MFPSRRDEAAAPAGSASSRRRVDTLPVMPDESPRGRAIDHAGDLSSDAPGADEVQVVPWPLLLRQRVLDRVEQHERYPWIVLTTVLFGLFSVGFTITILVELHPAHRRDLDQRRQHADLGADRPAARVRRRRSRGRQARRPPGPPPRVPRRAWRCVAVFAGLTALAPNAGLLILFRILGAATGAATGPASIAIINRLFPPSPARAGDGLLGDGRCRRSRRRRRRGRTDRRGVRLALDLRRAGAAHARGARARVRSCCPTRRACAARASTSRARSRWVSARRCSCSR